jgi:hypothetical protein
MEDAMTIVTKGFIDGGDISVATKGFLFSKFMYWFGELWKEVVNLTSRITKILDIDSPIN